jgi:hypothetical protein
MRNMDSAPTRPLPQAPSIILDATGVSKTMSSSRRPPIYVDTKEFAPGQARREQSRRSGRNNYPGVSYAADATYMQRRRTMSAGPTPTTQLPGYDATPNTITFKRKGSSRSGINLQDAMLGVRLSGKRKYLVNDLHLDANFHLTLKISVSMSACCFRAYQF